MVLLIFYAYPLFKIFIISITKDNSLSISNYLRIFNSNLYIDVLFITLKVALSVSILTLLLSYPTAYYLLKLPKKLSNKLLFIVLLPFWTSILVRSFAWLIILQKEGIVNSILLKTGIINDPLELMYNFFGVNVGMIYVFIPYMVLVLYSTFRSIELDLLIVGKTLGANPLECFLKIFFPQSVKGVFLGLVFVFLLSMGYFITPALLGGSKETMIAMIIDTQMNKFLDWGFGSALSFALFIIIFVIAVVISFFINIKGINGRMI